MLFERYFSDVAPFWDKYDSIFSGVLATILAIGYVTYIETFSPAGLSRAWVTFLGNSGLLALLTAWTAIIGLYRLRHSDDRTRPAVREDFEHYGAGEATDFGVRNYGPGTAFYVQAIATVESGHGERKTVEEVKRFAPHDYPIHLQEGEFASVVPDGSNEWIEDMIEEYGVDCPDAAEERENQPMLNLYFSYISHSGARVPGRVSAEREDDNILDQIKTPETEARRICLMKVISECSQPA